MEESAPAPDDIQAIYRLIHEVCELGADARAWRVHLQTGLMAMIGGSAATGLVTRLALDPDFVKPMMELVVETGMKDVWREWYAKGNLSQVPTTPAVMARFGTDFTCPRQDLIDDAAWYASDFYNRVAAPCHIDQHLVSQVCVNPPGVVDALGIARPSGQPPFTAREVAIVRMAHQELARLWRRLDPLGVNALPTRLRQTLHCVRRGLARKEIAQQLGLSAHTVHLYERTLFAKYGVDGRAELMARLATSITPTLLPLTQDNDFFTPAEDKGPSSVQADGGDS